MGSYLIRVTSHDPRLIISIQRWTNFFLWQRNHGNFLSIWQWPGNLFWAWFNLITGRATLFLKVSPLCRETRDLSVILFWTMPFSVALFPGDDKTLCVPSTGSGQRKLRTALCVFATISWKWSKNQKTCLCVKFFCVWRHGGRNHDRVDARDQDISARSRRRHGHQPRMKKKKKIHVHFSNSRKYLLTYFIRENTLYWIVMKFFEHVSVTLSS